MSTNADNPSYFQELGTLIYYLGILFCLVIGANIGYMFTPTGIDIIFTYAL